MQARTRADGLILANASLLTTSPSVTQKRYGAEERVVAERDVLDLDGGVREALRSGGRSVAGLRAARCEDHDGGDAEDESDGDPALHAGHRTRPHASTSARRSTGGHLVRRRD